MENSEAKTIFPTKTNDEGRQCRVHFISVYYFTLLQTLNDHPSPSLKHQSAQTETGHVSIMQLILLERQQKGGEKTQPCEHIPHLDEVCDKQCTFENYLKIDIKVISFLYLTPI